MKRHLSRAVALLLTLAMVLTLLPVTAWATEVGEGATILTALPAEDFYGVIYACGEGASHVMGYDITNGNAASLEVELNTEGTAIQNLPDGTAIIKFIKNTDGTYYFLLGSKYLVIKDLDSSNKEKLVLCDTAETGAKWTILADQAGMENAYNVKNAEYKYNGKDVYLEQYGGQKFCGWSYSSGSAKYFQFKFASTSADTDGRVGEIAAAAALPENGDTVVIYNDYAKGVFGQPAVDAAKPNLGASSAELKNGTLAYDDIGDGGLIFEVTVDGSEYTFKTGDKYLGMTENYKDESGKTVNDESLILVDAESGYTRWTVSQINGGWLMKNKEAQWKGNPVYIEYFDELFCGYSYDSSRPQIFAMNFYKVADKYNCGYVVNPAVVYAEGLFAAIGSDSEIKYTVDDLNELTATEAKYWFDGDESGAKTAEVTYENKVGSFTVPAVELVGHTALNAKVTLTDSMNIVFSGETTLAVADEPQILSVSPAANSATGADNLRPEITVNVTNAGEGAAYVLKLDDADVAFTNTVAYNETSRLWEGALTYTPATDLEEGKHTLYASVTRADGKKTEKNWSFYAGESGEALYFGQIHAHTAEYSDGAGTLEQAYEHAHEVDDLDYIIITDHSNYFDTTATATTKSYYDLSSLTKIAAGTITKWEEARQTAKAYDELYDDFVCAYGYEMTWSGGPGHTNSFNTFGVVSRNNAELNNKTGYAGMHLYNDLMVKAEQGLDVDDKEIGVEKTKYIPDAPVVSQFNHPGKTFGNFDNFAGYTASRDDVLNLVEVGNGEGKVGGSGYFPSYEQYDLALSMGWHIGPTNNQDNHKGKWGDSNTCRDVVLTDDFTEAGIYRALDRRRIYSTEDQNLEIYYTLNAAGVDYKLGDVAPLKKEEQPETVTAKLTINEPDRGEKIEKIQIIGEGATVLKEIAEVNAASYRDELTIPNTSGYYYIKVIEADGDIAVTAPVWTSETVPVAVELSTDCAVAAQGVEENILAKLVNGSESEALTLDSYKITAEGRVVAESTESEVVAAKASKTLTIPFTPSTTDPSAKKSYDITAEFTFTYKGAQSTYTKTISETSYPPEMMTYIGLDKGHTNFYVSGDYANNETSFIQICADNGIIVEYIDAGQMTYENLKKYKMVVLTVPRVNETTAPTVWTAEELAALGEYAANGGNLINLSKSDRYDYGTEEYASATISNLVNEAVGSNVRFAKGIVVDNEMKSNEAYRINFEGAERLGEHLFTRGISLSTNGQYQYYNGTGLVTLEGKEDQVTALVKPYDSTWIASYKANFTGSTYEPNYATDTVVAPKGSFNLITAEQLPGGGFLVCGGACFISNYDLKTGMSISEQYVNYGLVMNILRFVRDGEDNTVITPIADVHAAGDAGGAPVTEENTASGTEYTVEGVITSNASDYDKDTAFFDCIYVQDETRGINVFPVSGYYFIGEKVRVHGAITYYNGEIELNLSPEYNGSIEIVSNKVEPPEPTDVTCAAAMDDANIGNLVRVSGTISDIHKTEGVVDYVYVTDDSGTATLFINNYIQKDYKGLDSLKVGDNVVGTGIGSRDADENDLTGSTFIRRLRVRSRYEIYDPANPPVILDKTALQEAIASVGALNEADYTEESWAVLAAALAAANDAFENAETQEAIDEATAALTAAIAGLERKPIIPSADAFTLATKLEEGDQVVIYHPESKKAMGNTASGTRLAPSDVTVEGYVLTPAADGTTAILTVEYVDETNFLLVAENGSYLTTGENGNSLSLAATANEYSQWYLQVLDETAGTVGVRNTNAAQSNGTKNLALEVYNNNFTTYGWKDNNNAYIFQLYVKPAAKVFSLQTALAEGDEIIVYHPNSTKAMGKTLAAGNNNTFKVAASSDVTVEGKILTPAADGTTGVYTVEYVKDGETVDPVNFLLRAEDGTYLTSAAAGNSMSFETTANEYSQWYLQVLDETAGTVGVRSTNAAYNGNKNQALEYYSGFTTWSWKDNNDAYIFQLYVKGPAPAGLKTYALEQAIAAAEALNEADYTEETWAAVAEALAAAKALLQNPTTQEEIDAAAQALNDAIAALVRKPIEPTGEEFNLSTTLAEGDQVIIYHPTSGKAMGKTLNGTKVAAVDAAPVDGKLLPADDVGIYTVEYVENDTVNFLLKTEDGKYLTTAATGNSMSLEATANEYSQWYLQVLDETAGTVGVRSTNAVNGTKQQALEYYSGFTTYGWSETNNAFKLQLYVKPEAKVFSRQTALNEGDEVIVYHPKSTKAMGKTLVAGNNNTFKVAASSDVTVDNKILTPAADGTTGVYTVEYVKDGETVDPVNFLLRAEDGTYLTSAAAGNSMSFETTANEYSQWYLQVLDAAAGTVGIRSTNAAYNGNKNQALEYYSGFTTYSWRDNNDAFIFQLYVKGPVPAGLDTAALEQLIEEADKLKEADYTAESWAQFQTVLAAAKQTLQNATEQAELDQAANALRNAIAALVKVPAGSEWVQTPLGSIQPTDRVAIVFTMTAESKSFAVSNDKGTTSPPAAVPVTVSTTRAETKLEDTPDDNLIWNIEVAQDSTFIVRPDGDTVNNLYCLTSSNNGVRVGTNDAENVFELDRDSGYLVHRYTSNDAAATRYLGIYNEANLRSYTSINNNIKDQTVAFYVEKEIVPQEPVEFEFLVTSDLHGQIYATDYTAPYAQSGTYSRGLTRVASYIKEQKAVYGDNLYVVDMGDTFQGAPLTYYYAFNKPEVDDPAIKAFRSIGYDMWVVGNHEFNYGLEILTRQMDYAVSASTETEKQLTISMANYLKAETNNDETKDWATWRDVAPYVVKDFGGCKVAIIGFGNPNIPKWDVPSNWEGIYFANIIETYKHYEAEMLEKADMIVVVAHSGIDSDPESDFIKQLVNETNTIAFAFSGHEHRNAVTETTNADGKTVPILSPYTKARAIAQVQVKVDGDEVTVTPEIKNMQGYALDEELVAILQPYEIDTWENYMLQPIGKALGDYPAADLGTRPSAFMDLINKVQTWGAYDRTGLNTPDKTADDTPAMLSISAPLTSGSNANLISEGDIYLGDMFGLYRFENWFYQITMTGEEVHQWLEFAATKVQLDEEGKPYVTSGDLTYYDVIYGAGFHYEIEASKPEGERVVNMTYNGTPVAADQQFTVVVNNYRYNGGGNYVKWLNEHGCTFVANDPDRIIYSTQFDMIQGEDEGQARTLLVRYIEQETAANGGITPVITSDWIVWNGYVEPKADGAWTLAAAIEPGKEYVIVADGQYALNNTEVPGLETYSGTSVTRGSTAVTIEEGVITSAVDDTMKWTLSETEDFTAYDGEATYLIQDTSGKYLRRGSMSRSNSALFLEENLHSTMRYNTWSFRAFADADATYAMYVNSEREYGKDYAGRVRGQEAGFDIPGGLSQRTEEDPFAFMNDGKTSRITLYEFVPSKDIDFTDPEDASKFELVGATEGTGIVEGEGLALVTTTSAIELAGRNAGQVTQAPVDLVKVPVSGDWIATLELVFNTNGARNGYYQFFGMFAAPETEDFTTADLAGIRGGDGALQDFLRKDGTITADTDGMKSAPGFDTSGKTYYLRLQKVGTTYIASRSEDGDEFDEMFRLEDTGIEAAYILLDAYTGMTTGYKFTLKSLRFGEGPSLRRAVLRSAIAEAEALSEEDYTAASWAVLAAALDAARTALNDATTQDEIDDAAATLTAAIAALVDRTALKAAIDAAEALNPDKYTEESWAALAEKLAEAKTVYAKADATREELDAAEAALNEAIEALEKKPIAGVYRWKRATTIEPGKQYVIVSEGKYALNNELVEGLRTYSGTSQTLGATEVTIEDGVITSAVNDSMKWTLNNVDGFAAYDGETVYYLNDADGNYIRRGSMSRQNAALMKTESVNATQRYFTWTLKPYTSLEKYAADETLQNTYVLYCNSERAYGNDYAAYVFGGEFNEKTGFDIPDGQSQRSESDPFAFMDADNCSKITLYELAMVDIDFTAQKDADKYEIINQTQSAVEEGVGLPLITTRNAIETAGGQNSGAQAQTPEDLVQIAVHGDWIATLEVQFDTNGARNGYYQMFGFFAAASDDYGNTDLAGIRGGDGAMQDFLRSDGTITADTDLKSAPGFDTNGKTYFLRLEKIGTTYIASRSEDGLNFTEMFRLEDTGIEAAYILLDAYTGMTAGYKFTLKSLKFGVEEPQYDTEALEAAIAAAEELDPTHYTAETWAAVEEALEAARALLAAPTSQEEIDAAAAALNAAIEALELAWGDPTYEWANDNSSVTARREKIADETIIETETVATTPEILVAPTCTAEGLTRYTATFENTAFETQTREVVTDPIGHAYKLEGFIWQEYESAKAIFICEHDATHIISVDATITDETTAPGCEEYGVTIYTATVEFENETYTDYNYEQIDPLGHSWDEGTVTTAPSCTENGVRTFTCTVCGAKRTEAVNPAGHTPEAVAEIPATCTAAGQTAGTKCSVCGAIITGCELILPTGHTPETVPAVAPTCTETGLTVGVKCSVCDEILVAQQTVEATGHTPEAVPAVAPTCTETGLTEGSRCAVCGEILTAQQTVNALGHKPVTIPAVAPTCTEPGLTEGSRCAVCGEILTAQQTVEPTGHTLVMLPAVAATCTTDGLTPGWKCSVCNVILTEQQVVPASGHTPVTMPAIAPSCTTPGLSEGSRCSVCNAIITAQTTVPAKGHRAETIPAVAATCTTAGLTAGSKCADCGAILTAQQAVPAKGHSWNSGAITAAPSCTAKGIRTYTCTFCNETRVEAIDAAGHKSQNVAAVAATCTSAGSTAGTKCSVCGAIITGCETVPAKGHTITAIAAVPATCIAGGKTEGAKCSVCNEVIVAQKDVAALGHSYGAAEITKAPTAKAEGELTITCARCGDKKTESIAKLGGLGLELFIAVAKELETANCTEESAAALAAAITAAEAALETATTQAELDAALTAMLGAIENLEEKQFLFDDVRDPAAYYYDAVYWAVDQNITTGTSDTLFSPDKDVTRGQAMTFLWRAAGSPTATNKNNPFVDVKEGAFYYDAVLWAVEKGITTGTSSTKFTPNGTCTKAHIITFIWRWLGEPAATGASPFTDVTESNWYYKSALWANENGLVDEATGVTADKFNPLETCTRGATVTFLYRASGE